MFSRRLKMFWFCILISSLLWLFLPINIVPNLFHSQEITGCKIPDLNPWDPEVIKVVHPVKLPLICNRSSKPDLTVLTDGILKFHQDLIGEYLIDCADMMLNNCSYSLNCSYECARRGKDDWEIHFGDPVPIEMQEDTKIDCEFIRVKCSDNDTLEYAQAHSQIIANQSRLEELDEILPPNEHQYYHNVILFIFDSTSRLNFERYCPKTLQLLKNQYKAVSFKGLTRHGGGSWDNAIAFFGGKSAKNYSNNVVFNQYWDDWPFIWKNYSKNGYLTLDDQDSTSNIFLYMKWGFLEQPTDHRYRLFWMAASQLYNYSNTDYNDPCVRNNVKHRLQFQYLQQFLTVYDESRPKFAFFWNTALNHDIDEQLEYLDEDFSNFLELNYELLKNSFLFIMGDHGPRYGRIYGTSVGHFETHMPPLIVSVPEDLREEEPQLLKNLHRNSNVLVSHYDTFVTLHDILASQNEGWDEMTSQKDWSHLQVDVPNPQSYIRPLDRYRTCKEIGIKPASCICQQQMNYIPRETNYTIALNLSMALVDELNEIVSVEKQCAQMTFSQVLKLDELSSFSSYEKYKDRNRTFRILIEVKPSNGTFEGNVRFDGYYNFTIDGKIERTNKYGNQFHCIAKTNPSIKQYCYCE